MPGDFWLPGEPGFEAGRQKRRGALVCSRGHKVTYRLEQDPGDGPLGYCSDCGAPIIGKCPACGARIRGVDFLPGYLGTISYAPPKFCDGCGEPMPWAGRQERFYQLQNILDQQDIDQSDR